MADQGNARLPADLAVKNVDRLNVRGRCAFSPVARECVYADRDNISD
jgi:hypothetical protein